MYTKLLRYLNADFTLGNCLFGSVELTKNTDPNTYKHSGYGIVFNSRLKFSFRYGAMRKTFFIFGANMSSSVNIDNINKDILIIVEGTT